MEGGSEQLLSRIVHAVSVKRLSLQGMQSSASGKDDRTEQNSGEQNKTTEQNKTVHECGHKVADRQAYNQSSSALVL